MSQGHKVTRSQVKNKKILVTAGPTWVAIDNVRVISNTATGKTGILLAERLSRLGARVTLLLGPAGGCILPPYPKSPSSFRAGMKVGREFLPQRRPRSKEGGCGGLQKKIKIIRFKFFDELRKIIRRLLTTYHYDIIVHSAAVSDFGPKATLKGKLKSGESYNLKLAPLPKIADEIRLLAPLAKLILFKLEYGVSDEELIKRSHDALMASNADLTVANRIEPSYKAYILDKNRIYRKADSKERLIQGLITAMK
jgi:phosphopantothenoylcysteine decarboxylase/phosphopantothenate--cysteine ligase